ELFGASRPPAESGGGVGRVSFFSSLSFSVQPTASRAGARRAIRRNVLPSGGHHLFAQREGLRSFHRHRRQAALCSDFRERDSGRLGSSPSRRDSSSSWLGRSCPSWRSRASCRIPSTRVPPAPSRGRLPSPSSSP